MVKRTVIIGLALTVLMFSLFFAFTKGEAVSKIRYAVSSSLSEDFKIKESLGELFFAKESDGATQVSGEAKVEKMCLPVQGEAVPTANGGVSIKADKNSNVVSPFSGTVESARDGRLSVRGYDGTLAVINNVTALVAIGKKVECGELIGYSVGDVTFSLYKNLEAVDVLSVFE